MPANNRFSDNPFRDPNLTPEQVERIEKRNEALRIYRETGDEGPAIEIGLFPARPTKLLSYMKMEFPVTRTAPHAASINVLCDLHEHDDFQISIVDMDGRWGLGRKTSGGKVFIGNFGRAIRRCARLLSKECTAISEVDAFFENVPALPEGLGPLGDTICLQEPTEAQETDKQADTT